LQPPHHASRLLLSTRVLSLLALSLPLLKPSAKEM
jgi:hypothetical protein